MASITMALAPSPSFIDTDPVVYRTFSPGEQNNMLLESCSERPEHPPTSTGIVTNSPRGPTNSSHPGTRKCSTLQTKLDSLPAELIDQILSYLVYPRGHLPGLTEAQSAYDFPAQSRSAIKAAEDLTQPADAPHWATNLFALYQTPHPLNALAASSRRCRQLVENYCAHLVRACNKSTFNLPFVQFDQYGPQCVYPDLSSIVYRRLWLQRAPRRCVYCSVVLECYPFRSVKTLLTTCRDCFYRLTLDVNEVREQFHFSAVAEPDDSKRSDVCIRGYSNWVLRADVEALALRRYHTRAFHSARIEQLGKPCSLCAITRFYPTCLGEPRVAPKAAVRLIGIPKKRSSKRLPRH